MQSRKRPSPGSVPVAQQQQSYQNNLAFTAVQDGSNVTDDSFLNWNDVGGISDAQVYTDPPMPYDSGLYASNLNSTMHATNGARLEPDRATQSTQLVRRNTNQQLAARARPFDPSPWQPDFARSSGHPQQPWDNATDDEELEQKALAAKREAAAKRKQIPPFVQKLSSFLNEEKNTNLIRWSEDGSSFIVLDEDEFAKTLIPELFKHNNYASFVRQLNMYGFHKKVGLSDNSMNASVEKKKTPSEYFNKYFKRGRPELLWLIQKPKSAPSSSKRKREEERGKGHGDSDDDERKDGQSGPRTGDGGRNQDLALIPRSELSSLRSEIQVLQQQQKVISEMLNRLRRQNDQLYQQANAFQTLHDRHENSINAILTFLATFYNRSLEGHNVQTLTDMFAHAIPQNVQNHGNVVDVGGYTTGALGSKSPLQRAKRPLALLPPPLSKDTKPGQSSTSMAPSNRTSPFARPIQNHASVFRTSQQASKSFPIPRINTTSSYQPTVTASAALPAKVDDEPPETFSNTSPENADVMSAIRTVNATTPASSTSPQLDFPAALNHYQNANGNIPLTQQQRNDILSLMVPTSGAENSPTIVEVTTPDGNNRPSHSRSQSHSSATGNSNNALLNPIPPPMPSMENFEKTSQQLEMLARLQEEQKNRVHNLAERLGPLSPTGEIPGFVDPVYGDGRGAHVDGLVNNDSNVTTESADFDWTNLLNHTDDSLTGQGAGATNAVAPDDFLVDFDFNFGSPQATATCHNSQAGRNPYVMDSATDEGLGMDDNGPSWGMDSNNRERPSGRIVESISSEATSPAGTTVEDTAAGDGGGSPEGRKRRKIAR